MQESLIQRIMKLCTVCVLFSFCPQLGICQDAASVVDALVEMGFENVGYSEEENERVYIIQNSAYKLNGVGIGKAVDVVQAMGMPDGKTCRVVVLDNNIPQISLVCYSKNEADSLNSVGRRDWEVSYELGDSWEQARKAKRKNSSLYKVDIVVYPELSFKNLIITQIYQVLFNLNPTIEVSLWKGMKFEAQVIFPIYNEYGRNYKQIRQGMITLSQTVRLEDNVFITGSVGTFSNFRWGADLRGKFIPKKDERFSIEARIGLTGTSRFVNWRWKVSPLNLFTWSVGGSFFWDRYNTQFKLALEQYLQKENGLQFQMIRHFRHTSIGFWAMKTWNVKNSGLNGGFMFQIALPPYHQKRKGYIPRVRTSNYMGIRYNAGNEQRYGQTYKALPWDNYANDNSFNPIFIKSELLNY